MEDAPASTPVTVLGTAAESAEGPSPSPVAHAASLSAREQGMFDQFRDLADDARMFLDAIDLADSVDAAQLMDAVRAMVSILLTALVCGS